LISEKSPEKSTENMPRITSKKLKLNKQAQPDLTGLQASGSWAVIMGVNMI
jgi:hypothetical protein